MSEWFKELVLKTSDPARDQGFESLSLRHEKSLESKDSRLSLSKKVTERWPFSRIEEENAV